MSQTKYVTIEVVSGVEGPSLSIMHDGSGYRLAGPKPWGGGKTVHSFLVDVDELIRQAELIRDCKEEEE